jgi:hypothetical protein
MLVHEMLLLATCCTVGALAATSPPSPHAGWEPLGDSLRAGLEIDRTRIVRDGGEVRLRVRATGDRPTVAAEFEAAGAAADDVARVRASLHHSVHAWSFRCEERTHALATSEYYAEDGTLIRAFRIERLSYWPVQPDTVGQRLLAAACGTTRMASEGGPVDPDAQDDDSAEVVR